MIKKIEISGVHMEVGEELRKYAMKKIARLDRYISRHSQDSVHVEVKLKEGRAKNKSARTCEVIMRLPHEVITVSETTINIYAAVDIVQEKLKNALQKYKELHESPRLHQRLIAKLKRQPAL
jgi:putative sigma-54 modulation protein